MIRIRLQDLLNEKQKTLYWLRKQTGVSYPTLLRYAHNRVRKVDLDVLEKICAVLECELVEVLEMTDERPR